MSSHDQNLFDEFAQDYDSALAKGISVSGEDKEYFAKGRILWLAKCLEDLGEHPKTFLDYGCGTGSATPFIFQNLKIQSLIGVDGSTKSLEQAIARHGSERTRFLSFDNEAVKEIDIAFCNGVFHHIPPTQRFAAVEYIFRTLRPNGLLAFWENNPWNPGTQYVMRKIPFDRNAITLTAPEARRLLQHGGFTILRTDFIFIFPRIFRWLRWSESLVSFLPLGAQYQILCRRKE